MCSETASPRFSFSHDLSESHDVSLEEFEFSTSRSLKFESSSADELFSNGVILPIQIQDRRNINMRLPPRPSSTTSTRREFQEANSKSKSTFWGEFNYSRSKSLNCDTKKSFICSSSSSSSPPLSRSNSTGSAPNNVKKMNSNRQQPSLYPVQRSSSCKSYGNGHRISPVLNVPTPNNFSKLFGFGSLLRVGKAKKNNNTSGFICSNH